MNKHNVQATMKTLGWAEIEQLFLDEILENKKDIRTNGLDYETIAVHAIANKQASKIVKKVLNKLNQIANETQINKQSFK